MDHKGSTSLSLSERDNNQQEQQTKNLTVHGGNEQRLRVAAIGRGVWHVAGLRFGRRL